MRENKSQLLLSLHTYTDHTVEVGTEEIVNWSNHDNSAEKVFEQMTQRKNRREKTKPNFSIPSTSMMSVCIRQVTSHWLTLFWE
jgi:hypothetical protein